MIVGVPAYPAFLVVDSGVPIARVGHLPAMAGAARGMTSQKVVWPTRSPGEWWRGSPLNKLVPTIQNERGRTTWATILRPAGAGRFPY